MSATGEEDPMDLGDDLFGDEEEQEEEVAQKRLLDDEQLDSGDDEGRHDRDEAMEDGAQDTEMQDEEVNHVETMVMGTTLFRHKTPKPSDDELNTLKVPSFLSIAPKPYDATSYNIPKADHHSHTKSDKFSACDTAMTTIRYRKNPTTGKLESNTLLYRWSDGSVTMQVGDQHYEIASKQLSQPKTTKYKPEFDSNTYLTTAHVESNPSALQIVGHVSNQFTVRPPPEMEDDALEKLQHSMAAATRGRNVGASKRNMVETTQDPELQKKQAEIAEKERIKLQRRRETAAAKATQQAGRGLRTNASGLSIGDLEGRTSSKKAPKTKPRRSRYDDSDDDRPRGRGNQDEYDREDDFLASSDEEEEAEAEDEEDEDEGMYDQDSDRGVSKSKRGKKAREEDSDLDADGEVDPDAPTVAAAEVTVPRGKRRNIIEDDDDE